MAIVIPTDLILDILSRLPVKHLLRFRCVSKFFKTLIVSPYFINLHLSHHSPKSNPNLYAIYEQHQFGIPHPTQSYGYSEISLLELHKSVNYISDATLPRPDCTDSVKTCHVIGSCNGLLALHYVSSRSTTRFPFTLWNPSTGRVKKLPSFVLIGSLYTYGFGYDSFSDDYKLVVITLSRSKSKSRTVVFSLKTNSWKELDIGCFFLPRYDPFKEIGALSNNALHWRARDENNDRKIVAFDLGKEEFYDVPVLDCLEFKSIVKLSVLDGCLTATSSYQSKIYVWVMEEYGIGESWTKVMSCPDSKVGGLFGCDVIPLVYSRGRDKVLFSCDGLLAWYDIVSGKFEPCSNYRYNKRTRPNVKLFIESLVALDGREDEKSWE